MSESREIKANEQRSRHITGPDTELTDDHSKCVTKNAHRVALAKLAKCQKEKDQYRSKLEDKDAELEEKDKALNAANEDCDEFEAKIAQLKKENDTLRRKLARSEKKLKEINQSYTENEKSFKDIANQIQTPEAIAHTMQSIKKGGKDSKGIEGTKKRGHTEAFDNSATVTNGSGAKKSKFKEVCRRGPKGQQCLRSVCKFSHPDRQAE